jgi:chromate transport protein ChrA
MWLLEPALVFALTTALAIMILVGLMDRLSDQRLAVVVVLSAVAIAIALVISSVF